LTKFSTRHWFTVTHELTVGDQASEILDVIALG